MDKVGRVEAVHLNPKHGFSKVSQASVRLLKGVGIEGDAHAGVTVKHRSRVRADPTQPNLRQVHLIHAELFEEVGAKGFEVAPGDLGENVTTCGLELLSLPRGSKLCIGPGSAPKVMMHCSGE